MISSEELAARNVQNLNAALELTAGVTPSLRGTNADVLDQFNLRGFDVSQYLDGLRLASAQTGFAAPQGDVALLDRIEVLKGPASALYGQTSPGGLVALTSKLPLDSARYGSVAGTYGSFDLYRVDLDAGGRAGPLLYRAYGSINGADTQQRFGKRRRYVGNLAATLGSGTPTTLTLIGSYSHDPYNGNYGVVPRIGSLAPNPNGRIPRDFADGDPDVNRVRRNQGAITYLLDHAFGDGWDFHSRGRYVDVDVDASLLSTSGVPVDSTLAVFQRSYGLVAEKLHNATFDNQIVGHVTTGALRHTLLFGADLQFARSQNEIRGGFLGVPPINAYQPVYGIAVPASIVITQADSHQRQIALYAQDQIALGDLQITASGRYDWVRSRVETVVPPGETVKKDERFTWRVGALYKLDFGLAPYVSYSTSFQPQTTLLQDGRIADASRGRQFEAGMKYQPPGTSILLSGAYFDITQSNVVTANPLQPLAATQSGRVKSEGFEFEAKVPVYRGLLLTANYGRQKVRVVSDLDPTKVGRPLIGTTRDGAGLFARYTLQSGTLAGIGVGGGARYVGKGYGGNAVDFASLTSTPIYVPSYTLFDATISYDLGRADRRLAGLSAQVNAANLGDKRYVSSCFASGIDWCWYGSRRTVLGTIAYRW